MIKDINKPIGVYIHIPFCSSKCPYCNFYSTISNEAMVDKYVNSICDHIENFSQKYNISVDTIYFGGGTPNLIGENRIDKIINCISKHFLIESHPEITMESNPETGKFLDFKFLRSLGINRLSIGLQSANENELKLLKRKHKNEDVTYLIKNAQSSGISNISLDLMLAIPEQTTNSLKKSIKFCKSNDVSHISAYLLKIEPKTLFFVNKSALNLPNEDETVNLYYTACEELERYGYKQYEISNFAAKGKKSQHNLKYWNCDEYLGIGASAHSFFDSRRFYYKNSISSFLKEEAPVQDGIGSSIEEFSMLRLRLSKGLTNDDFRKRFSQNIPERYYKNANKYVKQGLVLCSGDSIKLTRKGFMVSNKLICEILY